VGAEQLANKIDVIHDVIMNNRYNGSQKTRQNNNNSSNIRQRVVCFALRLITARTSVPVNSAIRVMSMDILLVSVLGMAVHLMTNFQRAATLMRKYPQNPPRPWT